MMVNLHREHHRVMQGYTATQVRAVAKGLGTTTATLLTLLDVPDSALRCLEKPGTRLSVGYSDRVYRAKRLYESAQEVFYRRDAQTWITSAVPSLNAIPLSLSATTPGYELASAELERITHGILA
jgi:putative toxin-antitoxin system antitoxin component (TIGR02293 family)